MQDRRSAFLIAYLDDVPMGCGALRTYSDDIAEIKRVYAKTNKVGVAHHIIAALEKKAVVNGFHIVQLETRKVNTHAIQFYLNCGYSVIPNYGKYVERDEAICFSKRLDS